MDSKYWHLIIPFSWSEFKIPIKKKRSYATLLVRLVYKYLSKKLVLDFYAMNEDESLLIKHIFEANDLADLKSWIGIALTKKSQKLH